MKLFLALLVSCGLYAGEITIAVAANVSYAIDDLVAQFQKQHPEVKVRVILGSSGKLTAQIMHGAPYGLFMSANMDYPQALYKRGLAKRVAEVYAKGTLAMFSAHSSDVSRGIALLQESQIESIAIANPKTAPYGQAAIEALTSAGILDAVHAKLVYGESISQTVAYSVNVADVGIIATSALHSPKMKQYREGRHWIRLDTQLYAPIKQGIVLLSEAEDYKIFYDFIMSEKARKIFQSYGYLTV